MSVEINATNFPDPYFRNIVFSKANSLGNSHQDIISDNVLKNIKEISNYLHEEDFSHMQSMEGIHLLPYLESIHIAVRWVNDIRYSA